MTPIYHPLPVVGIPRSPMPSFRQGLAESSAKDGCLDMGSGIRVTFDHRSQPTVHLPVTGFRQSMAE
jgi:hypothetical protein